MFRNTLQIKGTFPSVCSTLFSKLFFIRDSSDQLNTLGAIR
jgi:hypothetical protein